jgi:hypothetical protein
MFWVIDKLFDKDYVGHWSDCAVYNEPAFPQTECNCGWSKSQRKWYGRLYHLFYIRSCFLKRILLIKIKTLFH